CSLRCGFCATAGIPFRRNLSAGEIIDQAQALLKASAAGIQNYVYMGMGEPLANFNATVASIRILTMDKGIASRRITVSTAGLVPQIIALSEEGLRIKLAVSLHSAQDDTRKKLMSAARQYNMQELADALKKWCAISESQVTIEYLLLKNVNDTPSDINSLINFSRSFPCKVNLIQYNEVPGIPFTGSPPEIINHFAAALTKADIRTTVRRSAGDDIAAACGQLATKETPDS
ncbi:MAG: radical SAM protein, partial [Spirochaetaceae bacterium]